MLLNQSVLVTGSIISNIFIEFRKRVIYIRVLFLAIIELSEFGVGKG